MKPYLYCLMAAILVSLPLSAAEVYKYKDKNGRTIYSDSPPPKDQEFERVEFGPINSQPAVQPQARPRPSQPTDTDAAYDLRIITPTDETVVPPGQRDVALAVQVNPPLDRDHALEFTMNGAPLEEPTRDSGILIEEIIRGTHALGARVVDSDGSVVAASETVTVHVQRPSVNSPARQ